MRETVEDSIMVTQPDFIKIIIDAFGKRARPSFYLRCLIILILLPVVGCSDSRLRNFSQTCESIDKNTSEHVMLKVMQDFEMVTNEMSGDITSYAFRLSEKYSADICFIEVTGGAVVSSRFSPD